MQYVCRWLDLPISATISSHSFSQQLWTGMSVKYQQCQITLHSSLKSSCDETITKLWRSTSHVENIQYGMYKNTKQVLKSICADHTFRLQTQLKSQGFVISFILEHSVQKLNSLWSKANNKLSGNIFNFAIKYLNNTLATRKNLHLWSLSTTTDCSFVYSLSHFSMLLHVIKRI